MTSRPSRRKVRKTSITNKHELSTDENDCKETIEDEQEKKSTQMEKKFFKTKSTREEPLKPNRNKKPSRNVKLKRCSVGVKFDLKELPSTQKKVLRPRTKVKNYCEDSILSKSKDISKPKGPIYKCTNLNESNEKQGERAYEFTYDPDSEHKSLPKKRKKRPLVKQTVKKNPIKTELKICLEKMDYQPKPQPTVMAKLPLSQNESVEIIEPRLSIKSIENVDDKRIVMKDKESNENIANKSMTQIKNMMNHSLLSKSLSPIKRIPYHFDASSPWRPPPLHGFSQIRNLYQSTPQVGKIIPAVGKSTVQNDDNMEILKKNVTRKFGTIITNIDHSINSNPTIILSDEKSLSSISMSSTVPLSQNQNKKSPTKSSFSTATTLLLSNKDTATSPTIERMEIEKENTIPKSETPKKSPKKSRLAKALRLKSCVSRIDNDPRPGPSNLQTFKPMKQTNLNNFLNLPHTPEASELFLDIHSTPVQTKPLKKMVESVPNIQNAFGFNDSDSDLDISPIDDKNVCKEVISKPARLCFNEIKTIQNKDEALVEKKTHVNDFSDTFDLMENENLETEKETPLFVDLEPSHFETPPKHSYKRKVGIRFNFLEDNESNEEQRKIKKMKPTKTNRKQNKRLKEWIKDVNRTFEEIDHFDLIIE